MKEAKARIRINQLLEEAGWRFFDSTQGRPNILLENRVKITREELDACGENFEKTRNGFVDFLILNNRGCMGVMLESRVEDKHLHFGATQCTWIPAHRMPLSNKTD